MSNNTVEFCDSVIEKVSREEENLRVRFSKMNAQAVELFMENFEIVGDIPPLPVTLDDGYFLVDQQPTVIPVPSEFKGEIELQLVFASGSIVIKSSFARIKPV